MPTITTKDGVEIFYKDWGSGQPIVFSHGWPLSSDDWDTQMLFFLNNGFRVVAHDRRGHGRSSQTGDGHDMDHYADDLAAVTGAELDVLAGDHDAAAGVDFSLCTQRSRWQRRRWQRCRHAGVGRRIEHGARPAFGCVTHPR